MATIWLAMAETTTKGPSKPTEAAELLYRAPRRLQRDLETFLALEGEWLPYRLWVAAGKKKLYERALKHGAPAEWADLLGLELRSRSQRTPESGRPGSSGSFVGSCADTASSRCLRWRPSRTSAAPALLSMSNSREGPLAGPGGYRRPSARRGCPVPRREPSKSCGFSSGVAPRGRLAEREAAPGGVPRGGQQVVGQKAGLEAPLIATTAVEVHHVVKSQSFHAASRARCGVKVSETERWPSLS